MAMAERHDSGGPQRPGTSAEVMLEEAFALARIEAARPVSGAFMARVLADAAGEAVRPRPAQPQARSGILRALFAALGGWPAVGGLATAGVAGFWFGLAPPAAVEDLGLWATGDLSAALLLPDDYSADISEG